MILGDQGLHHRRWTEIIQGPWAQTGSLVWWARGLRYSVHSPCLITFRIWVLWKHQTLSSLLRESHIPCQSSEGKVAHFSGSRGRRTASSVRGRDTLPPHGNSTPQGQKSSIIPSSLEIVPPGLRYGHYGEYSPEAKSGIFLVRAFPCK